MKKKKEKKSKVQKLMFSKWKCQSSYYVNNALYRIMQDEMK